MLGLLLANALLVIFPLVPSANQPTDEKRQHYHSYYDDKADPQQLEETIEGTTRNMSPHDGPPV
jgi:hypothetical protein